MRWRVFWYLAEWLARHGYRVEVHGTGRAKREPGYFIAFDHGFNEENR